MRFPWRVATRRRTEAQHVCLFSKVIQTLDDRFVHALPDIRHAGMQIEKDTAARRGRRGRRWAQKRGRALARPKSNREVEEGTHEALPNFEL